MAGESVDRRLQFGRGVRRNPTVIALAWERSQLQQSMTRKDLLSEIPRDFSGVYAIEGCHDALPSSHILYIGMCDARSLRDRMQESLGRVIRPAGEGTEVTEWSDVWSLVIRWARIDPKDIDLIGLVESLLIRSHLPQLNSSEIRDRSLPVSHEMVVVNGGHKGRLLPVVASYYFWQSNGWDDTP